MTYLKYLLISAEEGCLAIFHKWFSKCPIHKLLYAEKNWFQVAHAQTKMLIWICIFFFLQKWFGFKGRRGEMPKILMIEWNLEKE